MLCACFLSLSGRSRYVLAFEATGEMDVGATHSSVRLHAESAFELHSRTALTRRLHYELDYRWDNWSEYR